MDIVPFDQEQVLALNFPLIKDWDFKANYLL
eukprot:CAMPEP_0170565392 /NCGR_PEP_ID=MMETSP0211-20121228/78685_1 /TAXON_ID=311385 /ORGANISM="Pseudokeronopsis sp., Strain OXSARD2" /LENGTH=30 /DNA_ID= /DNA_START= /DNA_END= /DNA_ORIENTATION=